MTSGRGDHSVAPLPCVMPIGPANCVRIADVDGDLVFLDIERDDYIAVARCDAVATSVALHGGPIDLGDDVLAALLEQGFLAVSPCSWSPEPRTTRKALMSQPPMAPSFRSMVHFLRAGFSTWQMMRREEMSWTTRLAEYGSPSETSPAQVAALAAQFASLRAYAPRTGRCFIQSMMLMKFLAAHGVHASWVFGVRTHPFEAHCWVEWNEMVLNDTLDHSNWFSVIARF